MPSEMAETSPMFNFFSLDIIYYPVSAIMNQPAKKRSGLGRGLASLIPTGPADDGTDYLSPRMGATAADVLLGPAVSSASDTPQAEVDGVGATYREIDPGLIDPNPRQPRQVFDEEALDELVHSIREFGLMQPIVVRAVKTDGATRYQLVMGERRWRAAQIAELTAIPAIVRETADDSMPWSEPPRPGSMITRLPDSRGPDRRTSSSSRMACGEPPVTRDPRKYRERRVSGPQIPSGYRPYSRW